MSTYSQIYIQIVFAVKHRQALIDPSWEDELYKYITGIIQSKGQKVIAINGVRDHIHIFIGMKPACVLADLVREIKKSSNTFIKDKQFCPFKFEWQEGYGVFSYSHWDLAKIANYVMNQKEHHRKKTFKEEYLGFLNEYEITYKPEYLPEFLDEKE